MNVPNVRIIRADFKKGISEYSDEGEGEQQSQVICVGRSNAGKSTLINKLVGQKKLARASKQPGRTQQINIFDCVLAAGEQRKNFSLVDLPGYGFAVASKARKSELSKLLVSFLSTTTAARICLLIQDIRRDVAQEELAIRQLLYEREIMVQPVLTKIDKLGSNEKRVRIKAIADQYGLEPADIFVSGNGERVDKLLLMVNQVLV